MSRSNPYKKKPKSAKRTLLLYGEGSREAAFLKHLRKIYSVNTGISTQVGEGTGGTADNIVSDASRVPGSYDKTAVVLDNDKDRLEMERARAEARKRHFDLVENTPCLEAILLSIIERGNFSERTSSWCKQEFEKKYIQKKNRKDPDEYDKFFKKDVLEAARKRIIHLNAVISLIEGGF